MAIILTERAVKELKHIISEQYADEPVVYVRAGVRGGGCSGFQYSFNLDCHLDENQDVLMEQDGLKIVVDKRSMLYMDGTTIDFIDALHKRGFSFNNPSVKTTCGCGSSFSM